MKNGFWVSVVVPGDNRYLGLLAFVLCSALLHYLVFKIEVASVTGRSDKGFVGVGYVQRPISEFAFPAKPMAQAPSLPKNDRAEASVPESLHKEEPESTEQLRNKSNSAIKKSVLPVEESIRDDEAVKSTVLQPEKKREKYEETVSRQEKQVVAPVLADEEAQAAANEQSANSLSLVGETDGYDTVKASSGFQENNPNLRQPRLINAVPRYKTNPRPDYPDDARRLGLEGTVSLEVTVSSDGRVDKVIIKKSSGNSSLDRSAVKAVRRWHFSPALASGVAIVSKVEVPIRFALD